MNDFQTAIATILAAVLIVLAVWMFVRKNEQQHSKFKFLGVELESSTPAVIVLVAGGALLLGPSFTNRTPGGWPPFLMGEVGSAGTGTAAAGKSVIDQEIEPNDSVTAANTVRFGGLTRGRTDMGNPDFFLVTDAQGEGDARFILRQLKARSLVTLTIWDDDERELHRSTSTDTISVTVPSRSAYIVRIAGLSESSEWDYELVTRR